MEKREGLRAGRCGGESEGSPRADLLRLVSRAGMLAKARPRAWLDSRAG
jgi:hypothetical protein